MKTMDLQIVEQGKMVDALSKFVPNSIVELTDDEMNDILGGATPCSCKNYKCNHCVKIECLKFCRTKLFGGNSVQVTENNATTDTNDIPNVIIVL